MNENVNPTLVGEVASATASRPPARGVRGRRGALRYLIPVVGLLTFLTFSPALRFGFIEWDDWLHLVTNPSYRGLSWTHLHWMLTSVHGGHWLPATWLTFGLDYVIWGMDPFGYHLTNLLLHTANALLFFVTAGWLLKRAMPGVSETALDFGAAGAALMFALHPMRVESVAWITERRDLLSGAFWLLTVVTYLRAPERSGQKAGGWKIASLACYAVAVMAKSITVTLPLVLLILDVYPLRRHGDARRNRRLLLEKAPYLPMSLFGAGMAVFAAPLIPHNDLSFLQRIALTAYSLWFYVATTVMPWPLSPLYGLPPSISLGAPRFLAPFFVVCVIASMALILRRRWPALLAAAAAYVVMLAPVSGMLHRGPQIAADRYSYLACLPWALLFGGLVAIIVEKIWARDGRRVAWGLAALACVCSISVLPMLSVRQLPVWRNGDTLWRYTVAVDPDCPMCHFYLGQYLYSQDQPRVAVEHLSRAAALDPALNDWWYFRVQRGLAYVALGETDAAERELAALRSLDRKIADDVGPAFIMRW